MRTVIRSSMITRGEKWREMLSWAGFHWAHLPQGGTPIANHTHVVALFLAGPVTSAGMCGRPFATSRNLFSVLRLSPTCFHLFIYLGMQLSLFFFLTYFLLETTLPYMPASLNSILFRFTFSEIFKSAVILIQSSAACFF